MSFVTCKDLPHLADPEQPSLQRRRILTPHRQHHGGETALKMQVVHPTMREMRLSVAHLRGLYFLFQGGGQQPQRDYNSWQETTPVASRRKTKSSKDKRSVTPKGKNQKSAQESFAVRELDPPWNGKTFQ